MTPCRPGTDAGPELAARNQRRESRRLPPRGGSCRSSRKDNLRMRMLFVVAPAAVQAFRLEVWTLFVVQDRFAADRALMIPFAEPREAGHRMVLSADRASPRVSGQRS